jgi:glycogen synthase
MKIIIYSSTFLPNIGGLENIMAGLAEEWTNMGHNVVVYTATDQSNNGANLNFPIVFKTSNAQLNKAIAEADIYLEANISLKNCMAGLSNRKKWWVVHHVQYNHKGSKFAFIKKIVAKFVNNISVSSFIAKTLSTSSTVIHNFYSPQFRQTNFGKREYDFVYLGRIVSDKGVERLIKAMSLLPDNYKCLIIGNGEDAETAVEWARELKILDRVHFAGALTGEALVKALNNATTMVIPSIWDEPFGVVALEGMACGCMIACSNKPGLIEATGGLVSGFNPDNLLHIRDFMAEAFLLNNFEEYLIKIENHLQKHTRSIIAKKYIEVFENSSL